MNEVRKPPPFLLGAALLFWGWQVGLPWVAALLAVLLESARWLPVRWELSDEDFRRIWALCSVLLLGALAYAFTSNEGPSAFGELLESPTLTQQRRASQVTTETAAATFRWLPLLMFPLAAAQAYSARPCLTLSTISLLVRRRRQRLQRAGLPLPPDIRFHPGYVYFGGCLAGACMRPAGDLTFYWGMAALLAWALWPLRSRRYPGWVWGLALLGAAGAGFAGQLAVARLQQYVSSSTALGAWLSNLRQHARGSAPSATRISWQGLAPQKLSTRIVLRLEVLEGPRPAYLREATYRLLHGDEWQAGTSASDFVPVPETPPDSGYWPLVQNPTGRNRVRIGVRLRGRKDEARAGLLPLPPRTDHLSRLTAFSVERNSAGAVFATGPGLVVFEAGHGAETTWEAPPDPKQDLIIPEWAKPALKQVVQEMGLVDRSWPEVRGVVSRFFGEKFTYRLWQPEPHWARRSPEPLARFLLETRAGHCEYFATATVLLLRYLGIPARYAVGYAVHEGAGKRYVVRQRDAHAWCQVWNQATQQWEDFDTTPASWVALERSRDPRWLWLKDAWSWIRYQLALIWWGYTPLRPILFWLLTPALAILLFQIFLRSGRLRNRAQAASRKNTEWPGKDSEFYQLERWLATRGLARQPQEPSAAWIQRVCSQAAWAVQAPQLREILHLHYRYRFDPDGLSPIERERLRLLAHDCLKALKSRRRLLTMAGH